MDVRRHVHRDSKEAGYMASIEGARKPKLSKFAWVALLGLLVSLSACTEVTSGGDQGGGADHKPAAACRTAESHLVKGISPGLTAKGAKLTNAQAVTVAESRRNERGFPEVVVAANITGHGVGSWSISADGSGPLFALNDVAQQTSEWGAMATEGSPADQERDHWALMPETTKAEECAGG